MSSKENSSSSQPLPRDESTQQSSSQHSQQSQQSQQSQVEYQDCLACKLVGSTTFIGLGSYSIYQALKLNSTKIKNKSPNFRKVGLNAIGILSISVGIFRLFQ
ncbi:hypothetical protein Glove_208g28 [Diversispora epigaea]|uniref:Distal membrane-arm assembly complex protein 1-like domain-containing protein n=1 Tax=Diversispora epigaea TaxID=1348612 RepID=A0A397ILW3_9GLOM|nr:hypothetical protein Glove_208g28 [Diversispora epigaea]